MSIAEVVEEVLAHISERPWSAYTEADYTIEQWHSACLVHLHDGAPTSKSQCKLPVKTPSGVLNRNGVHAAAAALAGARSPLKASPEQKAKAARALRGYYSQLGEEPPDSLKQSGNLVENILTHFGKKGMKWGVRNESRSSGSTGRPSRGERRLAKAEKRFDKTFASKGKTNQLKVQLHNNIGPVVQSKVYQLNASPKYAKAISSGRLKDGNDPITKQYVKDFNKVYMNEMNNYLKGYQSPMGKKVRAELNSEDFLGFSLKVHNAQGAKRIKHADETDEILMRVNYIKDEQGRITGFEVVEEDLAQSSIDDILTHHGVKGMRWGVRRSRGPTAVTVTDRRKSVKTKGGTGQPAHSDAVRARTIGQIGKKSGLKALSNQELQAYNQRLNLEQQAKRLHFNDQSPPKKFVLTLLGQTGKQAANEAASTVASKQVKKLLAAAAV